MTQQHPVTPPPKLLKQWEDDWFEEREHADVLLIQAFQAGADAELEACLERILNTCDADALRAARRPKPPSLKELALQAINAIDAGTDKLGDSDIIRRALEQLDD